MSNGSGNGEELGTAFVGMLFALTVAEIAIQAANLVAQQSYLNYIAAYTHLLLATALVATSWVGWSQSKSRVNPLTTVFGSPFVILSMDVILVVFYFIIVKGVDASALDNSGRLTPRPSAMNESFWITVVFGLYLIWDLWTKFLSAGQLSANIRDASKLRRTVITATCFVLAGVVFYEFGDATDNRNVILIDVALCAIVFLFRSLKEWEENANGRTPAPGIAASRKCWSFALTIIYVGSLLSVSLGSL